MRYQVYKRPQLHGMRQSNIELKAPLTNIMGALSLPLALLFSLYTAVESFADPLPPSRRVFSADLDLDGSDELLIAHNAQLSAWRWLNKDEGWTKLWKIDGPGVAQKVLRSPQYPSLLVAWGMGKGKMVAPITVSKVDPLTGQDKALWEFKGGRSQIVSLQLLQADEDPDLELLVAHFVSKYHTRRVILDNLEGAKPEENLSGQIRMATSWLIADIDGKPGLEEVIGRVYGEERGEYGDLSVHPFTLDAASLSITEVIPTARGVKGIYAWPSLSAKESGSQLFFSDGWVAAYGKRAKAGLKRLFWRDGRINVESLASSPKEFTFFDMWRRVDPVTSKPLLFAQGNQGINLLSPRLVGPWRSVQLLKTPPIVNAAIAYSDSSWWAFIPSESGTQAKRLSLPPAL